MRAFHPLAGVRDLGQFDVDAGKLDGRRLGHVERGGHVAERRQHLGRLIDQVAQFAGIHRVRARTQPQVVKLDIAARPGEFDRLELSGQS